MQKLLVPADGSPNANRAAAHAIDFAKSMTDRRIVLLNVQEQLERWYAHGLNREAARKLLDTARCSYEFAIVFGKPAEVILRVAAENGATSIVMGARSLGHVESVFLWSASYTGVHLSPVPVTLTS